MKKFFLIIAIIPIIFISCEKEDDTKTYEPIPNEGY